MKAVSNTGPLIWLAKYSKMHLLKLLFKEVLIPKAVYHEAVEQGFIYGYQDAAAISNAVEEGWIKVAEAPREDIEKVKTLEQKLHIELGEGERETIALAASKKIKVLLVNDEEAAHTAKPLNLTPRGTLYILLKAVKQKTLAKQEAWDLLVKMIGDGFWISPKLIAQFKEALDRIASNT